MIQDNALEVRVLALEGLIEDLWRKLLAAERRLAANEQQTAQAFSSPYQMASGLASSVALTGGSGIPARSGTTPGSATVTLVSLVGGVLTSGSTATCNNAMATAVGNSRYIIVEKDADGNLWAVAEDCP